LNVLTLNTLVDTGTDFVAAGVLAGDVLEVFPFPTEIWTSNDYPTSVFQFEVSSVVGPTELTVSKPFPAFINSLNWEISARSASGTAGVTHRTGSPAGPIELLDRRFNSYFTDIVAAENFVTARKADLQALADAQTSSDFTDESFTASPTT
jgi:hypothetical protein